MNSPLRIALVGDYNPDVVAHKAIPLAIDDAAAVLELSLRYDWLATSEINSTEDLADYDAIWVVPASPYKNGNRYRRPDGHRAAKLLAG